ncbi:Crp/Fnr family transcriptional regulator [Methylobacterium nodulans]|uniref:Crp/Fnr family transcriptional regulator n=1 Tax=Methylobacterium nodulans TaxID=114616 RepID=UPI0002F9E91A|nr:Crp/Fnr family transcriptional regulator [Methylobacterium nodulans]
MPARTEISEICGAESIVVLLEGMACLYRLLPNGSRRILSLILPGEFCCGHLPDARPLGYAIGTLTASSILRVSPWSTVQPAGGNPKILDALRCHTLLKMNMMQEWLCNTGRGSDKQMAHIFCELLVRLQAIGLADANGFDLDITQADLADMIGISPVHANRVLKLLSRKKLLEWRSRRVDIPDVPRLKAFAAFSPHYLTSPSSAALPCWTSPGG